MAPSAPLVTRFRTWLASRAPMTGVLLRAAGDLAVRAAFGVAAGITLAVAALALDHAVGWSLPVPPGRATDLLITLTGASITVVVFALWMRSIVVSLVSGEFHARTLSRFLDDRFQRATAGWMLASFALLSTVALGAPPEDRGVTPPIATILAFATLVAALLAILLAVRHAAERLDTSELVRQLADEAFRVLDATDRLDDEPPPAEPHVVEREIASAQLGWVRAIDRHRLVGLLPAGSRAELQVAPGSFVAPGTTVVTLDAAVDEATADALRSTVAIGRARDERSDIAWSLGELTDICRLAGASGDSATAIEILHYLEALLGRLLDRGLPTDVVRDGDRILASGLQRSAADLVSSAARRLRHPTGDPELDDVTSAAFDRLAARATERGDHDSARAARG
ncbi:MAG: DUF2254 family protein [Nitriliruptor sp.]